MRSGEAHSSASFTRGTASDVFFVFLKLGLTSFGGPVAHLGYFRDEFVLRRKWLEEQSYADIVALCQFLPGPASSQVGITIGLLRAGLPGAVCAWLAFTAPSALAMILFGYGVGELSDLARSAWLHGFKIVAVAVVAGAVWGMARSLCPDRERLSLAVSAAVLALALPSTVAQIGVIVVSGLIGWRLLPPDAGQNTAPLNLTLSRAVGIGSLVAFVVLLLGLPLFEVLTGNHVIALFDSFYRSGSLVFGGGHVVLPLLQQEVVPRGWVGNDVFLAGYGAAQAVPGPLFTFAAYLGTVIEPPPNGWIGGLLCLLAIYLPSFLLLLGVLPFWDWMRKLAGVQSALQGINAGVVGLLLAALYMPVWTSAINRPSDFMIALMAFLLLAVWKVPPWLVVVLGAIVAAGIAQVS